MASANPLFVKFEILKVADIHRNALAMYMFRHRNSFDHHYVKPYTIRNNEPIIQAFQRLSQTQRSFYYWGSMSEPLASKYQRHPNFNMFKLETRDITVTPTQPAGLYYILSYNICIERCFLEVLKLGKYIVTLISFIIGVRL